MAWTWLLLIIPGGILVFLLAALIRAIVGRVRSAAPDERRIARLTAELDLTDDEAEQLSAAEIRAGTQVDVIEWRRARLRRLSDAYCTGFPPIVRQNVERMINETPDRAARVLDDDDEFRLWAFDEGIHP